MKPVSIVLVKNWWSLLIRGFAGLLFGSAAVLWHGISFSTLVMLFFSYTLVDGLVAIAGAVRAAEVHDRWGSLLLEGVAGITTAVIAITLPETKAFWLVYVIAAWGLATGLLEIASAVRLRRYITGAWLLALSGVASLGLSLLMATLPFADAVAVALAIGGYAILFGALLVVVGLRLRVCMRTEAS